MKLKQTEMTDHISLVEISFQVNPTFLLHSVVEKQIWKNNNN